MAAGRGFQHAARALEQKPLEQAVVEHMQQPAGQTEDGEQGLVEAASDQGQAEVEAALTDYESRYQGQVKMRCVGPLPPCNFLELVITWDD